MSAVLDNPGHVGGHDHGDPAHRTPTGWRRWLYATNHKDIGRLYLLFSRTMFMVGVFLTDAEPADPAPARLDFSPGALGDGFTAISPAIGQTFYIGDGLTGNGAGLAQQFLVPANATRLFLGFADAPDFGAPSSAAGYYGDNVGQLTATFAITQPQATPNRVSTWGRLKSFYR